MNTAVRGMRPLGRVSSLASGCRPGTPRTTSALYHLQPPTSTHRYLQHSAKNPRIPDFAFVFDIDGVLLRGKKALPKAKETLEYLDSQLIPFVLLTNGGGMTEERRARVLSRELGFPLDAGLIVQSHTPFEVMDEHKKGCALVVGGEKDLTAVVADKYGYQNVITPSNIFRSHPPIWPFSQPLSDYHRAAEDNWKPPHPVPPIGKLKIDSIFVYNDPRDWGLDLALITDCLLSEKGVLGTLSPKNRSPDLPNRGYQQDGQPPLFFSNDDLWFAADFKLPRLGQGGFRAALEGVWREVTGGPKAGVTLQKTIIGKPHQGAFEFAERKLDAHRKQRYGGGDGIPPLKEVYMVGDNPASDIRGAANYQSPFGTKWSSALVRTGVYTGGEPSTRPSTFVDHVGAAVQWATTRSKWRPI